MIVEKIDAYLQSQNKTLDESTLRWALARFEWLMRRRFMEREEERRTKWLYATLVTGACAKKAAYKYHGRKEDEPLSVRAQVLFFMGDIVELAFIALAKIAGADIEAPYELLKGSGQKMQVARDGLAFGCWPDAVAHAGETWMNVEVKKMSDFIFDRAERDGGPNDEWGYLTQSSLEVLAWRQAGFDVKGTLFLGLRGLTGHKAEWVVPYDEALVNAAFSRAKAVQGSVPDALPPRGYALVPETKTVGKGDTKMQVATGRMKLAMQCGYCAWKRSCWPGLTVEVARGKPVFYVSETPQTTLLPPPPMEVEA